MLAEIGLESVFGMKSFENLAPSSGIMINALVISYVYAVGVNTSEISLIAGGLDQPSMAECQTAAKIW
jgi:hypothetical protein